MFPQEVDKSLKERGDHAASTMRAQNRAETGARQRLLQAKRSSVGANTEAQFLLQTNTNQFDRVKGYTIGNCGLRLGSSVIGPNQVGLARNPLGGITMKVLKAITFAVLTASSGLSLACDAEFNITLQTFGEGVLVELRLGEPGQSRVVKAARSSGGLVQFAPLCPGRYFLAIGDDESVSVTPVRNFENGVVYSSRITLQRGAGNVSRKSRKSL